MRRFFRGAVCNANRAEGGISGSTYMFAGEVVEVGIQSYRKFWISRMLLLVLFGKDWDVFVDGEVIKKNGKKDCCAYCISIQNGVPVYIG